MFSNKLMRRVLRSPFMKGVTSLKTARLSVKNDTQMMDPITEVDQIEYADELSKHTPLV